MHDTPPRGTPATPPATRAPEPAPEDVAERLRLSVGALVRATRTSDELAPIPAAVLDLLLVRGPMTTADLAAGRGVRHQTMAATVKELTEAGYLVAAPDPGDGRKKLLTLTARGRSVLDADRHRRVGMLAQALRTTLTGDERSALAQALVLVDRITAGLSAAVSGPPNERGPVTGAW